MDNNNNQVLFLEDKSSTGKVRPWQKNKIDNLFLSEVYKFVNEKKSNRLIECSDFLEFKILDDEKLKLHKMNSCRVRLCPICGWRRSLKCFSHMSKILECMEKNESEKYQYIFVTLTIKNIDGDLLNDAINDMMKSWDFFARHRKLKNKFLGFYRALEITHDVSPFVTKEKFLKNPKYYKFIGLYEGSDNPNYDKYHPHFHCIFSVPNDYFINSELYVTKNEIADIWKKCLKVDYNPVVDVRKIKGKGNIVKAVSESTKYTLKGDDYLIKDDFDLSIRTVALLDKVLDKRRFISYGGKFKEWHKKLNLDDEMNGDLINVDLDSDILDDEKIFKTITYFWNSGYSNYTI